MATAPPGWQGLRGSFHTWNLFLLFCWSRRWQLQQQTFAPLEASRSICSPLTIGKSTRRESVLSRIGRPFSLMRFSTSRAAGTVAGLKSKANRTLARPRWSFPPALSLTRTHLGSKFYSCSKGKWSLAQGMEPVGEFVVTFQNRVWGKAKLKGSSTSLPSLQLCSLGYHTERPE